MEDLQDFLKGKKYKKIPFKVLKTQHLLIKGTINGVKGQLYFRYRSEQQLYGF